MGFMCLSGRFLGVGALVNLLRGLEFGCYVESIRFSHLKFCFMV